MEYTTMTIFGRQRLVLQDGEAIAIAENEEVAKDIISRLNSSAKDSASAVIRDRIEHLVHALKADQEKAGYFFDLAITPMSRADTIKHLEDILRIGRGDARGKA
jgi:hypothetical protein